MKRAFLRHADIGIFWMGWFSVLVFSWTRFPIEGAPYSVSTFLLLAGCIAAFSLPFALVGSFCLADEQSISGDSKLFAWVKQHQSKSVLIALCSLAAYDLILRQGFEGVANYDLVDRRELRGESIGTSPWMRRGIYVMSVTSVFGAFVVGSGIHKRYLHGAYFAGLLTHSLLCYRITASREHSYLVFVYFAALLLRNVEQAWRNRRSIVTSGIFLLLAAAVLNVLLNLAGQTGGYGGSGGQALADRGQAILVGIGLESAPQELGVFFGLIDEYIFAPVFYFDFYITTVSHAPAFGSHSFDLLAGKFGFTQGQEIKLEVDEAYGLLARSHNVWATGFREVAIECGRAALLPTCLLLGIATAVLKRLAIKTDGASLLYCLCVAWMWFSPVSSLLKSMMVEMSFYFAAAFFLTNIAGIGRRSKSQSL